MIKRFLVGLFALIIIFNSNSLINARQHLDCRNFVQPNLVFIPSSVQSVGLPDLEAPECEFDDQAIENELFKITVLVVNTGNAPSRECQVILYLSPKDDWDLRNDEAVQQATIPGLSVYGETFIDFTFVFPDMGNGKYQVWALFFVDAYERVEEISEANLYKSEKPIQVVDSDKEKLPDLKAVKCHYEREVKENTKTAITVRVNNIGNVPSKNCWMELYLSPKDDWNLDDDTTILEVEMIGLPANGTTIVEFNFIVPNMGSGEYQVWPLFFVDSREQVSESSESNIFKSDVSMIVKDPGGDSIDPDNPSEGVYPRKVLMEVFTATWCGPCATYDHLADQVADEFGSEKVLLIRNQCWDDGLNTSETDARASFYKIQGVPAIVIGGTKQSHPSEIEANSQTISQLLTSKSPFKITMQSQKQELKIQISNGSDQSFQELHLITVLYESLVDYSGTNGIKEHKKVIRDYIGNEKGISISVDKKQTVEQTFSISYAINTTKEYYLVSFLQDVNTKEIYQAERVLVGDSTEPPPKEEPEPEKPSETFQLNATCQKTGIVLTWEKVNQATNGYHIYKKDAATSAYPVMPLTDFPVKGTTFEVTRGLKLGESYCFIVKPIGNGLKEISHIVSTEICVLFKVEEDTFSVVLQIGSNTGWLNDKPFSLDVSPEITKERMFVPIRIFSEVLGAVVEYDANTKRIKIDYTLQSLNQVQTIEIFVDQPSGKVNEKETYIDPNDHSVTPYINNGRTMVPMRFIGEALLAKDILWDPLTQKVKFVFLR